jgi:D-alanine-D-alanine ligase
MLRHLGIPTPEWAEAVDQRQFVPRDTYIIKALYEDASIGLDSESVRSFRDFGELKRLLEKMKAESGREFFAERFIDGREFGISILGENGKPRVLTPSELRFPGYDERNMAKVLDYDAKWEPTSFGYQNIFSVYRFAHEDSALLREMQAISEKCWSFFGLSGYARIDFRVDKEGRPWVLEINANPCITPGESGFLRSAEESGFDFGDVIDRIISEAWSHDLPRSLSRGRGVV